MSDQYLTEREWKSFSRNVAYKAGPLTKALTAFERAGQVGPEAVLEALDDVDRQSSALLAANKADKALAHHLNEIGKAAKKARKEAEQALEAAAQGRQDEGDDEPGDALLDPKRLLAQLNLCKRDPERRVQFGFVDAKDKQPAALALSPKMTAKRLFARLQSATGVKTGAFGSAWVDGTVLMLQLDKPLSGLVKKVRLVVKECGFRATKVVLWNADGSVFEQDEETDAEGALAAAEPTGAEPPATADAVAEAPPAPADDMALAFKNRLAALIARLAGTAPDLAQQIKVKAGEAGVMARKADFAASNSLLDEADRLLQGGPAAEGNTGAAFNARLAALVPRVQAARAAGHPAAKDIALKISEAGAMARDKAFVQANALLDDAQRLLAASALAGATGTAAGTGASVSLRAAVQAWRDASATVDEQISALAQALRATGDKEMLEISEFGMNGLTGNFKVRLMALLPELESAQGQAQRAAAAKALPISTGMNQYLQTEPRVQACDDNPFGVAVSIRSTLGAALEQLSAALQGAAQG